MEISPATRKLIDQEIETILQNPHFDAGLLNSYGGGNVDWWHDYIRAEINRCNEHWRELLNSHLGD